MTQSTQPSLLITSPFIVKVRGAKLQHLLVARVGVLESQLMEEREKEKGVRALGGYQTLPIRDAYNIEETINGLKMFADIIDTNETYSLTLDDFSKLDLHAITVRYR